jgi:hypothetical protein
MVSSVIKKNHMNIVRNIRGMLLTLIACTTFLGCDKDDKSLSCLHGKFIQQWCTGNPNVAIIQILSSQAVGEDWSHNGKAFSNTVIAEANDWSSAVSGDSTFYFQYSIIPSLDVGICYICCPPTKTMRIDSFRETPCSSPE